MLTCEEKIDYNETQVPIYIYIYIRNLKAVKIVFSRVFQTTLKNESHCHYKEVGPLLHKLDLFHHFFHPGCHYRHFTENWSE